MNVAFQIYTSIAMAITTVCAVVAVAYWIDDVIVGRKKHNRLRGEIWSALRDTAQVYGEQGVIPSEVVLEVLHNLYNGKFIDWRQIKMDKEAMEWPVKSAEQVCEEAGRKALERVEYAKKLEVDANTALAEENARLRQDNLRLNAECRELLDRLEVAERDAKRIDWLAVIDSNVAGVYLPSNIVIENIHDLRSAIDATMKSLEKNA